MSPSPPDREQETAPSQDAALGLAALGFGLSLALLRFAWLPLVLQPSFLSGALAVIGGVGLAVGVMETRRRPRPTLARGVAGLLAGGLLGLLLILGIKAWLLTDRFVPRHAPGIALELPDWPIQSASTSWPAGSLRAEAPGGEGRFIRLHWALGQSTLDELQAMVVGLSGAEVLSRREVQVSGHAGLELITQKDNKQAVWTLWVCPEDGRTLHLVSFVDRPTEALLALHRHIVASLHCHQPVDASKKKAAFARLPAPPGWTTTRRPGTRVIQSPSGDASFILVPATGEAGILEALKRNPELASTVLKTTLAGATLKAVSAGAPHGDRLLWTATAADGQGDFQVILVAWPCASETLLALWVGPADASRDGPQRRLLEARCPPR